MRQKKWRFHPGRELPPPKKVKSKEDVSESTKNYEKNKRQWPFQSSCTGDDEERDSGVDDDSDFEEESNNTSNNFIVPNEWPKC